jgi:hypothetical protein
MSINPHGREKAAELYEAFGRPLEAEHWGEFVAISEDGRTMLGSNLHELASRATVVFGRGNYIFKIGERVVGKWR